MSKRIIEFGCASLLALMTAQAALAQEGMPRRKPGLWDLTLEMQMRPGVPMKSQQCVDAASDDAMQRRAMSGGDEHAQCSQKSLKRSAGALEMQAECTSAEGKTFIDSRMSGDFNSHYSMENKLRYEPPRHGMKETTMKIVASHAGACPAGMKPGDVRMLGMTLPGGAPGRPGGPPGGMPGGIDPSQLKGMSPEELKKWAEQMKKAQGN